MEMAMKRRPQITCVIAIIVHLTSPALYACSEPFDGRSFRGRIAYSCDGNNRDRDDLFALEKRRITCATIADPRSTKLLLAGYAQIAVGAAWSKDNGPRDVLFVIAANGNLAVRHCRRGVSICSRRRRR